MLYSRSHAHAAADFSRSIERGCSAAKEKPLVFFRADDIGVPSRNFTEMIACFKKHRLPLCLATVPSWSTRARTDALLSVTGTASSQWYWHQHGRTHHNFETLGKKQEFGPSRNKKEITQSLKQGRSRLQNLLGREFHPVFTPPWNRCSSATIEALIALNYDALSRSSGAQPPAPHHFPDFQINIDLHTRKESSPEGAYANLLREIEQGFASGTAGIMLHHQRMNRSAFELLDLLLFSCNAGHHIRPVHFGDLLSQTASP